MLLFAGAALIWLAIVTRGRLREVPALLALCVAFGVLFATYVTTSIYTGLTAGRVEASASGVTNPAKP